MESTKQDDRPQPGVWKNKITGALYELHYSSTGVPLFVAYNGSVGPSSAKDYALVEPGATLASPLFRAPSYWNDALLRLTEAALRGLATNAYNDVGDGEELGIVAARAARATLAALRAGERSSAGKEPAAASVEGPHAR